MAKKDKKVTNKENNNKDNKNKKSFFKGVKSRIKKSNLANTKTIT